MDIAGNRTLSSIFRQFAAFHPDKTYLIFEDLDGHCQQWSFAQFEGQVNQTARWLLEIWGSNARNRLRFMLPTHPFSWPLPSLRAVLGRSWCRLTTAPQLMSLSISLDNSESRLVVTEFDQLTAYTGSSISDRLCAGGCCVSM